MYCSGFFFSREIRGVQDVRWRWLACLCNIYFYLFVVVFFLCFPKSWKAQNFRLWFDLPFSLLIFIFCIIVDAVSLHVFVIIRYFPSPINDSRSLGARRVANQTAVTCVWWSHGRSLQDTCRITWPREDFVFLGSSLDSLPMLVRILGAEGLEEPIFFLGILLALKKRGIRKGSGKAELTRWKRDCKRIIITRADVRPVVNIFRYLWCLCQRFVCLGGLCVRVWVYVWLILFPNMV